MNLRHKYMGTALLCMMILLTMLGSSVKAEEENVVVVPTLDAADLVVSDLDMDYYELLVDWMRTATLPDGTFVDAVYFDAKLRLAEAAMDGTVTPESFESYRDEFMAGDSGGELFKIALGHVDDKDKLDLTKRTLVLNTSDGGSHEASILDVGPEELKTSYSKGIYYRKEYLVSFGSRAEEVITPDAQWMSVSFGDRDSEQALRWDFVAADAAGSLVSFSDCVKVIQVAILAIVIIALVITRPRREDGSIASDTARDA